jgi:hypothetical protein
MNKEKGEEEKSLILGSWRNVHLLLVGTLVAIMVLLYLFTQYFK